MRTLRWLRTYKLLVGAAWRAEMQYRGNLLVNILGGLCYQGAGLAFIWAVLARFGNLGGWTLGEIAFLYGLRLAAHGLWIVPGHQLLFVDQVVVEENTTATWCVRHHRCCNFSRAGSGRSRWGISPAASRCWPSPAARRPSTGQCPQWVFSSWR